MIPINEMLLPEEDESPPVQQQEVSTEVYDNYSFEHQYDDTLPITDERQNVVQTIESNRVTIIQGIYNQCSQFIEFYTKN